MLEKELKDLILKRYKSIREFANVANLPYTTVDSILKRGVEKANIINIIKICDTLDIDTDELADGKIKPKVKKVILQLSNSETQNIKKYRELDTHGRKMVDFTLDEEYERCISVNEKPTKDNMIEINYSHIPASAGAGAFLDDENLELREYPDTPEARRADIVIPVTGQSMEPMFYDGDELYVRLQPDIEIGEVGIFIMEDNGYVKKKGKDRLISLNPDYEDIYPSEYDAPRCIGKVIGKVE